MVTSGQATPSFRHAKDGLLSSLAQIQPKNSKPFKTKSQLISCRLSLMTASMLSAVILRHRLLIYSKMILLQEKQRRRFKQAMRSNLLRKRLSCHILNFTVTMNVWRNLLRENWLIETGLCKSLELPKKCNTMGFKSFLYLTHWPMHCKSI